MNHTIFHWRLQCHCFLILQLQKSSLIIFKTVQILFHKLNVFSAAAYYVCSFEGEIVESVNMHILLSRPCINILQTASICWEVHSMGVLVWSNWFVSVRLLSLFRTKWNPFACFCSWNSCTLFVNTWIGIGIVWKMFQVQLRDNTFVPRCNLPSNHHLKNIMDLPTFVANSEEQLRPLPPI